jgi:hypothetical protein
VDLGDLIDLTDNGIIRQGELNVTTLPKALSDLEGLSLHEHPIEKQQAELSDEYDIQGAEKLDDNFSFITIDQDPQPTQNEVTTPAALDVPSSAIKICSKCNETILNEFLKVDGRRYHLDCFVCVVSSLEFVLYFSSGILLDDRMLI